MAEISHVIPVECRTQITRLVDALHNVNGKKHPSLRSEPHYAEAYVEFVNHQLLPRLDCHATIVPTNTLGRYAISLCDEAQGFLHELMGGQPDSESQTIDRGTSNIINLPLE